MTGGNSSDGFSVNSTKNLAPGMVVDIENGSSSIAKGVRITEVDHARSLIKFDDTSEFPAGDLYVQGSKGNELTGLGAIFGNSESLWYFCKLCQILLLYSSSLLFEFFGDPLRSLTWSFFLSFCCYFSSGSYPRDNEPANL